MAPPGPSLTTGTGTRVPNASTASRGSDRCVNHCASGCDGMKIVTRFTISRNPGTAYTSGFQPMSRDVVIRAWRNFSNRLTCGANGGRIPAKCTWRAADHLHPRSSSPVSAADPLYVRKPRSPVVEKDQIPVDAAGDNDLGMCRATLSGHGSYNRGAAD